MVGAQRMQRILIVRLSAIGDVIHGIPVLCALRAALPEAHIGWVVEGRAASLLERHPAIDSLIALPRGWLRRPGEILSLRRRLQADRFDTVIDLQCLTKSAIAAWLSGAPRRIGKAGSDGRELSKLLHTELVTPDGEHVIEHYLGMLAPLGIRSPQVQFHLPENPQDESTIESFLSDSGLQPKRFAVLNPGAGWPSKLWPAQRYGQLAKQLFEHFGIRSVIVWAGAAEHRIAHIAAEASRKAASVAPATGTPATNATAASAVSSIV